jgi:hypothetical protein
VPPAIIDRDDIDGLGSVELVDLEATVDAGTSQSKKSTNCALRSANMVSSAIWWALLG